VKGKLLYLEVFKAPFYDKEGNIIGTVGAGRDITDLKNAQLQLEKSFKTLKEQQEMLSYQATHDTLTNLPNRILFHDRLKQSLKYADKYHQSLAILFIDLDNFKDVNDLLGHTVGDKVLLEATKRLTELVDSPDSIARLGGDEFSIILNDITTKHQVEEKINTYMDAMKEAFIIDNNFLHISMSIGISMYPEDGNNISTLLQFADVAMYQAKINGKHTYSFYNEEMTKKAQEKTTIERELRKAFEEDLLEVYYQPQINAKTHNIVGMEALVRWNHPSMGLIYPERFIALAETNGMILELDRIVMKKAIKQFFEWSHDGLNPGKLSLNLSMKQIEEEDFFEFIKDFLLGNGFSYHNIEFEITETQLMRNPERSIQTLKKISDLGITISVDDFGTGYSSFLYLKRLPISKVKIDKSFIKGLPDNNEDQIISKAIIDLCKNLNLEIIAEGVETNEQKQFLLDNGCELIQGHLFYPALSITQVDSLLKATKQNRL